MLRGFYKTNSIDKYIPAKTIELVDNICQQRVPLIQLTEMAFGKGGKAQKSDWSPASLT